MAGATGHRSAEEIHAAVRVRAPSISSVTIYRTLETFEAHGLVVRCSLGDRVLRWEQAVRPHHHLICSQCGAVVDLDDMPFQHLAGELRRDSGVLLEARHLSLHGVCARCASQRAEQGMAEGSPVSASAPVARP